MRSEQVSAKAAEDLATGLGMIFGWVFIFMLLFALIATLMARHRGRSGVLGFFGGFFFGVLSIIYYLIAGDTTEKRVWREEQARQSYSVEHSNTGGKS